MANFIDEEKQLIGATERQADDLMDANFMSGAPQSSLGELVKGLEFGMSVAARFKGAGLKASAAQQRKELQATENRLLSEAERIAQGMTDRRTGGRWSKNKALEWGRQELMASTDSAIERDFIRSKMGEWGASPIKAQIDAIKAEEEASASRVETNFREIPPAYYGQLEALRGKSIAELTTDDMDQALYQYGTIKKQELDVENAEKNRVRSLAADADTRLTALADSVTSTNALLTSRLSNSLASFVDTKTSLQGSQEERAKAEAQLNAQTASSLELLKTEMSTMYDNMWVQETDTNNRNYVLGAKQAAIARIDQMKQFYETSSTEEIAAMEQALLNNQTKIRLQATEMFGGTMVLREGVGDETWSVMSQNMWTADTVRDTINARNVVTDEFGAAVGQLSGQPQGITGDQYEQTNRFASTGDINVVMPQHRDQAVATTYKGIVKSLNNPEFFNNLTPQGAGAYTRGLAGVVKYTYKNTTSYDDSFEQLTSPRAEKLITTAPQEDQAAFRNNHVIATNQRFVDPNSGMMRLISDFNSTPSGSTIQFDPESMSFRVDTVLQRPGIGFNEGGIEVQVEGQQNGRELADQANKYLQYMIKHKENVPAFAGMSDQEVFAKMMAQVSPYSFNVPVLGTLTSGENNAP